MAKPTSRLFLGVLVFLFIGLAGFVGYLGWRISMNLDKGKFSDDPDKTCFFWKPIRWPTKPSTIFHSGPLVPSDLIVGVHLLKSMYVVACQKLDGQELDDKLTMPPYFTSPTLIYGVDRGQTEPFGLVVKSVHDGSLNVAFRGSMSIKNWLSDFNVKQTPYPGHPGMFVHEGFLKLFSTIVGKLDELVKQYPNVTDVFCCGHSLGCALATFSAIHFANLGKRVRLAVYGCPRIGNTLFSEMVEKVCDASTNVMNLSDVVVNGPLAVEPKFLKRGVYLYQHFGLINAFSFNQGSVPMNHHIDTYEEAVWKQIDQIIY